MRIDRHDLDEGRGLQRAYICIACSNMFPERPSMCSDQAHVTIRSRRCMQTADVLITSIGMDRCRVPMTDAAHSGCSQCISRLTSTSIASSVARVTFALVLNVPLTQLTHHISAHHLPYVTFCIPNPRMQSCLHYRSSDYPTYASILTQRWSQLKVLKFESSSPILCD